MFTKRKGGILRFLFSGMNFTAGHALAILAFPALLSAQGADLSITKDDRSTAVKAGTELSYRIEVRNIGPADAANVTVVDRIPDEASFVSAPSTAVEKDGIVNWTIGDLKKGAKAAIDVTVRVKPSATGTLIATASVSSSTQDGNQQNNSGTDSDTLILTEADLAVSLKSSATSAAPGDKVTFTISVKNNGPSDLQQSTPIQFTLPRQTTFHSASDDGSESAGIVSWPLNNLNAGATEKFEVTLSVDESATTAEESAAATADSPADPDTSNNKADLNLAIQ